MGVIVYHAKSDRDLGVRPVTQTWHLKYSRAVEERGERGGVHTAVNLATPRAPQQLAARENFPPTLPPCLSPLLMPFPLLPHLLLPFGPSMRLR